MGNATRGLSRSIQPTYLYWDLSRADHSSLGFTSSLRFQRWLSSGQRLCATRERRRQRRPMFGRDASRRRPLERLLSVQGTGSPERSVCSSASLTAMERHAQDSKILDGKAIARQVTSEVATRVQVLREAHGRSPGLAVVIVGSRPDSQTYVRNKRRACEEAGMNSHLFALDASTSETELIELVRRLNAQDDVDGILVQLPLPDHIRSERVLQEIAFEKDVDGFHPLNVGRLCQKSALYPPLAVACTPRGCLELLDRAGVDLDGKHAVVLGRSNVVGLPMALLLLQRNATVTICHSHTADLADQVSRADILVAAIGRAHFVKGDWIKPGAVVIDVGINSVPDTSAPRGYRLVGDVEFQVAKERAALITPVPGGVGPMTIAMLLLNTLQAFERRLKS
ncbi:hypothetical protein CCYA_CCYA02G0553 [Cyanidiococcus yangmingshanensis]|nr:hypothetical protein CCYA_CCYA02G0553 [Cyanidiococcus yangmingshanensis]